MARGDYAKEAERYSSGRFMNKEDSAVFKEVRNFTNEIKDDIAAINPLMGSLSGLSKDYANFLARAKEMKEGGKALTADELKLFKDLTKQGQKFVGAVNELAPGMTGMVDGAYQTANAIDDMIPGIGKFAFGVLAAWKIWTKLAAEVASTRAELGISAIQAAKVTAQTKILGKIAEGYGLTEENIVAARQAGLEHLGLSVDESMKLSLNLARTANATGQTEDAAARTLAVMESISSSSRDVLLNQMRSNAAMIEAAGVAPSLVMRDIAENAEFFASYAKDGGQNLIAAGTAARKLGLDMSAVASVTDSLLDFESSIESSMEASMLLGRQINTDRARMLALAGDQEGMMKEVQRLAGGEAEFNRMNVLARRALAKSLGTSVEQLARMVRGQTAGVAGAAVGNAMGDSQQQVVYNTHKIVENTSEKGVLARFTKTTAEAFTNQ